MIKRAIPAWITVILVLMLGPVIHAATYKATEEFRFDADEVVELSIRGVNGSITFLPWDEPWIGVTATKQVTTWSTSRARSVAERITVAAWTEDGWARVEASLAPSQLLATQSVSFEVRVPAEWYAVIDLTTSNGSIRAEAIYGDVRLETSNGSITVNGHAGYLHARTSNGRIELYDVDTTLNARTSNGRVTVSRATLHGVGEIYTSNGSVTLRGALQPDAEYVVRTTNGSIDLTLAAPADVALDLRTTNGSVNVVNAGEMQVSEVGRSMLQGHIGKGSARLQASTSNGSITLAVEQNVL